MRDDFSMVILQTSQFGEAQQSSIHAQIQRYLRLLHMLAPVMAAGSGALHAYGMALRKRHGGEAAAKAKAYWTEPGWWLGLLMDLLGGRRGCRGVAFSLAAPLMAVELLVPLTAVAQLATAFLCGCFIFQERSTLMQQLGFVLSVTAVVLLGSATFQQSQFHTAGGHNSAARFWKLWIKPYLGVRCGLWVHAFCFSSTLCCFLCISHATAFAVLSAYFDGIQFLFTRTIAVILEAGSKLNGAFMAPWPCAYSLAKAICAIGALHWQQHALGEDLTAIGSVLPLLQMNLTQASLGSSFFGDMLRVTPSLVAAALLAPLGVWLLAQTPATDARAAAVENKA
eukprot:Skav201121  [mRNA]  locus=scaffold185:506227:512983:- [translate_table: standard]